MHYETKGYKFSLSDVERAWKALIDVSYSSEMDTEEFNEETVQVEHYCGESEKNKPLELGYKGSKANLGTESERYTFVSFSDVCLTCVIPCVAQFASYVIHDFWRVSVQETTFTENY